MKILSFNRIDPRRTGASAFTLAEMLIAMTVFTFVIAAMVATQIFGMRVYTLAATKLSATTGSRQALNTIRTQIREAKLVDVGTCLLPSGGPASFNSLGLTNFQVGNAVRVSTVNNWTTSFTIFYQDGTLATTNYLMQCVVTVTTNSTSTNYTYGVTNILASYITNSDIFAVEDYQGNILTNDNVVDDNLLESIPNRMVVAVKLQFYQWEYPIAVIGTNSGAWNAYDYYQLRTKITRRAWD